MRTTQERQEALVEEVKALLKEKGKTLDPELLARLSSAQGGVVENSASRFANFWQVARVPVSLLLIALFALLFFFLIAKDPESPAPTAAPPGVRQGRVGAAHRR